MKHCTHCGTEIPAGRLKMLPYATTCTAHSTTSKFGTNIVQVGHIDDDGYQEFEVVRDPETIQALHHYRQQLGKYQ